MSDKEEIWVRRGSKGFYIEVPDPSEKIYLIKENGSLSSMKTFDFEEEAIREGFIKINQKELYKELQKSFEISTIGFETSSAKDRDGKYIDRLTRKCMLSYYDGYLKALQR